MSEKTKNGEFEEKELESSEASKEIKYEENDNWEFQAKALTLENDDFEADGDLTEAEPVKVSQPVSKPKPKPVEEKKETKTSKKLSKNAIKFILTGVVSVVVAAVLIVFGVIYYTVPNTNEKMNPGNVALKIDKTPVSIGMYNYYYNAVSNNYISYAQQGYYQLDTSVDYSKQKTTDSDGNEVTWAQLFENDTIDRIQYITAYYQEAVKHGVTLTDTQKEEIEENIKIIKEAASEADLSVDEYVSSTYGENCGLATIRKLLVQSYTANNYYRQYLIENKVDEKDVNAYFEKHKDDYTEIDFAYLFVVYDQGDEASKAKAEKNAKKYASEIKNVNDLKKLIPTACKDIIQQYVAAGYYEDEDACAEAIAKSVETSITKSDSSFTAAGSEWLFSKDTKKGDCSYFLDEANSAYFVLLKTNEPHIDDDEVYSVRHILIMPESESKTSEEETEQTEKTYTKEEWAAAEKKAKSILAEYEKGEKTELAFARLAEKYSDDTESTSNGSSGLYGGLYEGTPLGQMVKSFEEWSTDKSRKYGDTAIVKSDFGYHIMFFVEDTTSSLFKCEQAVVSQNESKFTESFKVKKHKSAMKKTMVAKPQSTEGSAQVLE
jgi:hypothetical protein